MKHCVIYNCLIPERLHRGVGSSPSLKAFPSSVSEPCGATFTDTATNRRVLHSQTYTTAAERVKGYCFPQDYRQKGVCFFCCFCFCLLLTKWPFFISYEQLPDAAAGSRFIFRTRTLPGAFHIKAARLAIFFIIFFFFTLSLKKNNNVAFQ